MFQDQSDFSLRFQTQSEQKSRIFRLRATFFGIVLEPKASGYDSLAVETILRNPIRFRVFPLNQFKQIFRHFPLLESDFVWQSISSAES